MALFDGLRGRLGRKKSESSGTPEDSFDLDDEALFGSEEGDGGFSDLGGLDATPPGGELSAGDSFASFGMEEGDVGAASTADFEDLGDLGGDMDSPPLDDLGEDLGGEFHDTGFEDLDAAPAKKGRKGKGPRRRRRGGGVRSLVISALALLVPGVVGFVVAGPAWNVLSGKAALRREIAAKQVELGATQAKLKPLQKEATPAQVEVMQAEMAQRAQLRNTIDEILAKVADVDDRKAERRLAFRSRDAAGALLGLRQAELNNIAKQVRQVENRVDYLHARTAWMEGRTATMEARAWALEAQLPPAYVDSAMADAAKTLSVQAILEAAPAP